MPHSSQIHSYMKVQGLGLEKIEYNEYVGCLIKPQLEVYFNECSWI